MTLMGHRTYGPPYLWATVVSRAYLYLTTRNQIGRMMLAHDQPSGSYNHSAFSVRILKGVLRISKCLNFFVAFFILWEISKKIHRKQ